MKTAMRAWFGVLALFVVVAVAYVDRVNVSVLVLDRGFLDHFQLAGDRVGQGSLMTVFLLGYGASAFLLTPFYEALLGTRAGLVVSVASWAALTALAPSTSSFVVLVVLRILLGIAEGPLFSMKVRFVAKHFPAEDRGKPNAVSSMGVSVGLAAGYPLVTVLLHAAGWRASFGALAFINVAIALPLVLLYVREPPNERRRPGIRPFVRLRTTLRDALATRQLGAIILVEIFTLAYLWGSSFWLPAFLARDRHFSLTSVGWISAAPFVVSLCANVCGGVIVDLIGGRRLPAMFVVGGLACASSVAVLMSTRSGAVTLVSLLCASAAWGLQSAAIPTFVQRNAPPDAVGSAYGVINGIGNLVSAAMPLAMGSLMKRSVASGFILLLASQLLVSLAGLVMLRSARGGEIPDAEA